MYFTKQKNETIFYRKKCSIFYKKFNNLKHKEVLNRELMKLDANNIDYEIFHETDFHDFSRFQFLRHMHLYKRSTLEQIMLLS